MTISHRFWSDFGPLKVQDFCPLLICNTEYDWIYDTVPIFLSTFCISGSALIHITGSVVSPTQKKKKHHSQPVEGFPAHIKFLRVVLPADTLTEASANVPEQQQTRWNKTDL